MGVKKRDSRITVRHCHLSRSIGADVAEGRGLFAPDITASGNTLMIIHVSTTDALLRCLTHQLHQSRSSWLKPGERAAPTGRWTLRYNLCQAQDTRYSSFPCRKAPNSSSNSCWFSEDERSPLLFVPVDALNHDVRMGVGVDLHHREARSQLLTFPGPPYCLTAFWTRLLPSGESFKVLVRPLTGLLIRLPPFPLRWRIIEEAPPVLPGHLSVLLVEFSLALGALLLHIFLPRPPNKFNCDSVAPPSPRTCFRGGTSGGTGWATLRVVPCQA